MNTRIRCSVTGGLGNQLFKSIGAINLAKRLSRLPELDISWYYYAKQGKDGITKRRFELEYFPNIMSSFEGIFCSAAPLIDKRMNQLMRRSPKSLRNRMGIYIEEEVEQISIKHKKAKIVANFEHVKYLPEENHLKTLLQPIQQMSSWQERELSNIGSKDFIGVHVRLGDYLKFPQIYNVLTPNYYLDALSELPNEFNYYPIILFSDDPKLANYWLGNTVPVDYSVKVDSHTHSAETMMLLSKAKAIITAHSTFSWWAARIGTLEGTTTQVVIPKKYFADQKGQSSHLHILGWKQV